ncbi:MAG: DUF116 domain-containing protein [Candidatus Sabulitectum sp.]|nr:DUF116 domain-containing protein [Candidatus Sabulitectum sp.]
MKNRSQFHYHLGLTIFSLFPGVIVLLLTRQWYGLVATVVLVNTFGLFRTNLFLSLSFHVLKPLAGLFGGEGFAPEEMVITLGSEKTLLKFGGKVPAGRILLLLPHCLQRHECQRRITFDPYNCVRCGQCPVGALLDLADRTGVKIAIATGGTLARRHIIELKPLAVVAVACPRDLGQGMLDAHPVPVAGVENQRPAGDCLDTTVDIITVEKTIGRLTGQVDLAT